MKKITFKIESEEKEFAFSVDLTQESFAQVKHILLKNIEKSISTLLQDNVCDCCQCKDCFDRQMINNEGYRIAIKGMRYKDGDELVK